MKKLLLTTFIFTLFACVQATASMIIVDYQGETRAYQQTVERHLVFNSNDDGVYDIAVRPLEEELQSIDGKVRIPLRYLFINNNSEDVYLRYNEYSNVFRGIKMGGIPHNMTARIRDYGMVPAGIYNMNFEIQATDVDTQEIVCTSNFNLQFIVPTVQQVNLHGQIPTINVGANEIINKTKRVVNTTSPMVYVNSNADWILYLNTDNFDDTKCNYYVRTISGSTNVRERLQERVLLKQGREIILAKGKAPANNEFVTVEYSIENEDGKLLRAGSYENKIRYMLREDRG